MLLTRLLDHSSVRIFDAAGRLVRTLTIPSSLASPFVTWNGRDQGGVTTPAGVYIPQSPDATRQLVVKTR
jgi:hypothetical protein